MFHLSEKTGCRGVGNLHYHNSGSAARVKCVEQQRIVEKTGKRSKSPPVALGGLDRGTSMDRKSITEVTSGCFADVAPSEWAALSVSLPTAPPNGLTACPVDLAWKEKKHS